ncbi:MAG TPA: uroporphyrinogen decarboxylase [Pseudolysinimonas sp.]|nr:uroporphyrinogen decarboxylase [Pseudolysinimonas sp.]
MPLPAGHPLADGRTISSSLVQAARGVRPPVRPVWFMRQAGRSLPEYRELRAGGDMLAACLNPEIAAEITLQPVRRHGVDAGVFFSDIVVPVLLAGVAVQIVPGRGPVFDEPVRSPADVARLPPIDPAAMAPIADAVALAITELGGTPLIGFGGAPYTLASYLVEGGPSKEQLRTRALLHSDPDTWAALLDWCADVTGAFLRAQVLAGASAVQLFDSWAGSLSRSDYEHAVLPHSKRALDAVVDLGVPRIHFGVGTEHLLDLLPAAGADVVGVDWRVPLDEAARRLPGIVLQGNIDPALLFAPADVLERHVADVLRRGDAAPAHIVNLGHGVPPDTDPDVLTRIVEIVHAAA